MSNTALSILITAPCSNKAFQSTVFTCAASQVLIPWKWPLRWDCWVFVMLRRVILLKIYIWIKTFWWWVIWLRFLCPWRFLCFIFIVCAFWSRLWSTAGFSFLNFHPEMIWNFSTIFSSDRLLLRTQATVIQDFFCVFTLYRSGSFRALTHTSNSFLKDVFEVLNFTLAANESRSSCSWMNVTIMCTPSCTNVTSLHSLSSIRADT